MTPPLSVPCGAIPSHIAAYLLTAPEINGPFPGDSVDVPLIVEKCVEDAEPVSSARSVILLFAVPSDNEQTSAASPALTEPVIIYSANNELAVGTNQPMFAGGIKHESLARVTVAVVVGI